MIPVTLFNANTLWVTVAINGASAPEWIGGTNAALGWEPQSVINAVQMNPGGPPSPNILAVGLNNLAITAQDSTTPPAVNITLPGNIQWSSVQLYVFFNTTSTANWLILNAGQYVTGGVI